MLAWLLSPIDPSRAHDVGALIGWHGRLMVVCWSVLAPIGVLAARFGKVPPWRDWPRELDDKTWWRAHLIAQNGALAAAVLGLALVLAAASTRDYPLHRALGWAAIALLFAQVASGYLRGDKGGPTAPDAQGGWRGDHYDMTPRRRIFEYWHKSAGYLALLCAVAATATGLWAANAPNVMWLLLGGVWVAYLALFIVLQRYGCAQDTYQAIWGPSLSHPGNRLRPIGLGVRRFDATGAEPSEEESR